MLAKLDLDYPCRNLNFMHTTILANWMYLKFSMLIFFFFEIGWDGLLDKKYRWILLYIVIVGLENYFEKLSQVIIITQGTLFLSY